MPVCRGVVDQCAWWGVHDLACRQILAYEQCDSVNLDRLVSERSDDLLGTGVARPEARHEAFAHQELDHSGLRPEDRRERLRIQVARP